jgi:hypothetical protein
MPTTFTGGDLKVAAQQSIVNIQETLLPTKAFSTKVDTSGLGKGDTTQVFVVGNAPEAGDFDRDDNNYMTDNGGEHAWKPVKLDTHKKLTFKIPPNEFRKLSTSDLADLYKPYVSKLCEGIISAAFAKITVTDFPNAYDVGNWEDFDKDVASQAEKELAKLAGTSGERNLILNMDCHAALRESLTGLYVNPVNSQALMQGSIPGISGFKDTIRTTALKSVGTEKKKYLIGIATNMSGIAMAFAPVEAPPQFDGDIEAVSSAETFGIPITFSVDYSKDNRDYVATVEALYGIGIMSAKGILRLTTEVK